MRRFESIQCDAERLMGYVALPGDPAIIRWAEGPRAWVAEIFLGEPSIDRMNDITRLREAVRRESH